MASYQVNEPTALIRAPVARSVCENRNFGKLLFYAVNSRKKIPELILTEKNHDDKRGEGGYLFLTVVVAYVSLVYIKLQHEVVDSGPP